MKKAKKSAKVTAAAGALDAFYEMRRSATHYPSIILSREILPPSAPAQESGPGAVILQASKDSSAPAAAAGVEMHLAGASRGLPPEVVVGPGKIAVVGPYPVPAMFYDVTCWRLLLALINQKPAIDLHEALTRIRDIKARVVQLHHPLFASVEELGAWVQHRAAEYDLFVLHDVASLLPARLWESATTIAESLAEQVYGVKTVIESATRFRPTQAEVPHA